MAAPLRHPSRTRLPDPGRECPVRLGHADSCVARSGAAENTVHYLHVDREGNARSRWSGWMPVDGWGVLEGWRRRGRGAREGCTPTRTPQSRSALRRRNARSALSTSSAGISSATESFCGSSVKLRDRAEAAGGPAEAAEAANTSTAVAACSSVFVILTCSCEPGETRRRRALRVLAMRNGAPRLRRHGHAHARRDRFQPCFISPAGSRERRCLMVRCACESD